MTYSTDARTGLNFSKPYRGGRKALYFNIVESIKPNTPVKKRALLLSMGLQPGSYPTIFAHLKHNKIIDYDNKWRIIPGEMFFPFMLHCYKQKRLWEAKCS